jgi:hypothetical protein
MSKSKLPEQINSEEIDLGQLFKVIGKGFYNFFNFIGKIFIGGYKVLLLLLIHFFKRKYWYAGAFIIGLLVGLIIDETQEKEYGANMFIETNFNSSRQVYENIKQFHQLAYEDKDTLELSKRLKITPQEASKLKGFYIEPDIDENELAKMYSKFYTQLDSVSRVETGYKKYQASLTPYNFNIHKIGVASTDKSIYKKIEEAFINGISGNTYLNELVEVNRLNLEKKDQTLLNEARKTDSLLNEYLKIRIKESEKELVPGAGTNLYMGNAESNNLIVNETNIIDKILLLEAERRTINKDKVTQKNVINVLANFPESGYDTSNWYDEMKFLLPLILFTLTLLIFTLTGVGKYLDKESKQ